MIKILQIIVFGILFLLVIRLVRLVMKYLTGSRRDIDGREKEREEINRQFENIEEAEFKDISSDENGDLKDSTNDR